MSKSYKPISSKYISTTGIVHNHSTLSNIIENNMYAVSGGLFSQTTSDLDDFIRTGTYYWNPDCTNIPVSGTYGTLFTFVSSGIKGNNSNNWVVQIGVPTYNTGMYYRQKVNSGAWQSWVRLAKTEDSTKDAICAKISSRYSYSHTQWDNITVRIDTTQYNSDSSKFSVSDNGIKILSDHVKKVIIFAEISASTPYVSQADIYIMKNGSFIANNYGYSLEGGITNISHMIVANVSKNDIITAGFHYGRTGSVLIYENTFLRVVEL